MSKTITTEHPPATHVFAHISDTHLMDDGLLYGTVDADKRLRELSDSLERRGGTFDAIIITGDIADEGQAGAYSKAHEVFEKLATNTGAELAWVMGNHDNRSTMRTMLDCGGSEPLDAPLNAVKWFGGLRLIILDSTVPSHHYGLLSEDTKAFLTKELAVPAPAGTVIAMHHPPVPSMLPMASTVELREQAEFACLIRDTDVRLIIGGHLHYSSFAMFAGIPVSVASSSCYTQDLSVAPGGTRGHDSGHSYNLIHVYPETVLNSVVPIEQGWEAGTIWTPEAASKHLSDNGIILRK